MLGSEKKKKEKRTFIVPLPMTKALPTLASDDIEVLKESTKRERAETLSVVEPQG